MIGYDTCQEQNVFLHSSIRYSWNGTRHFNWIIKRFRKMKIIIGILSMSSVRYRESASKVFKASNIRSFLPQDSNSDRWRCSLQFFHFATRMTKKLLVRPIDSRGQFYRYNSFVERMCSKVHSFQPQYFAGHENWFDSNFLNLIFCSELFRKMAGGLSVYDVMEKAWRMRP